MCRRPVCLPILFRLWAGKGSASPVELARTLVGLLARAFPDRSVHVAADAAYHGRPLRDLPDRITWTTRLARNAVLFHLPPPRTGRRGRPRTKGERIGSPVQAATHAPWRQATVTRYGHTTTVHTAELACLWYGAFGTRPGRLILVRDTGRTTILALFTTDTITSVEQVIARYAGRWSIEVAIETAKGPMGIGQARNRVALAVQRTVPFSMIVMSLVIVSVRPGRPPPQRHHRPAHPPTLVRLQDRTVLRRHDRQAAPHHHRRAVSTRTPRPGHARANQRRPPGLGISSRVAAKVE